MMVGEWFVLTLRQVSSCKGLLFVLFLKKQKRKWEVLCFGVFFPFTEMIHLLFLKHSCLFVCFLNNYMSLLSEVRFVNKCPLFPASVVLEKVKLLRRLPLYLWIVWVSILLHPSNLRSVFTSLINDVEENKPWNSKDDLRHFLSFFSIVYYVAQPTEVNINPTWHCNIFLIVENHLHDQFLQLN